MKLTIKKGLLGLGTVASVAAPIAAVISCGTTKNTINWDENNDKFGGVSGHDFLSEIKHLGKTKEKAVTIAKEQMVQLQYESESIRSLRTQEDDFKFSNWKIDMDIKKLEIDKKDVENDIAAAVAAKIGADPETQNDLDAQITSYNKQKSNIENSITEKTKTKTETEGFIKKIETAIDKIDFDNNNFIPTTHTTDHFFDKDYNSTDYPLVYKPLSKIKDDKTSIVNDAYRNFYPQFTTREDGDKEWPTELAKTYGGAATFEEAINYLITNEISEKAFELFKFDISKKYTVEQMLWSQYISGDDSYKFLKTEADGGNGPQHSTDLDEDIKLIMGDENNGSYPDIEANILSINSGKKIGDKIVGTSVLSSPEIFLGSKAPDFKMPTGALDSLKNVIKYQHLLVKATQGTSTNDLWTITADDLTKLMTYKHVEDLDGKPLVEQGIKFITSPELFERDTDNNDKDEKLQDMTDFILKEVSGNSEGTLTIQGSLGIKTKLEYLKTMVPGFSIGGLAKDGYGEDKISEIDLDGLIANLKTALDKEVLNNHATIPQPVDESNMDKTNIDITSTIKDLGDEKVKTIFGRVFSEFFADKKDLIYKVKGATNNYLVISQFGIHIIRESTFDDSTAIKSALITDIKNMADDSSLPSATGLASELGTVYTDTKIMETLLKDTEFEKELGSKLDAYNEKKVDGEVKEEVDQVKLEDVKKLIESINRLKATTDLDEAMGDKLEKWLVTQLDSGLRNIGDTKLDDIYEWAKEAGGVQ